MSESISFGKNHHKRKTIKWGAALTTLAAVATIVAFIISIMRPDSSSELREVLHEYATISQTLERYEVRDSVVISSPDFQKWDSLQSKIELLVLKVSKIDLSPINSDEETNFYAAVQILTQMQDIIILGQECDGILKDINWETSQGDAIPFSLKTLHNAYQKEVAFNNVLQALNDNIDKNSSKKKVVKLVDEFLAKEEVTDYLKTKRELMVSIYDDINILRKKAVTH